MKILENRFYASLIMLLLVICAWTPKAEADSFDPKILIDSAGNSVAVWMHSDSTSTFSIHAGTKSSTASTWTTTVLSTPGENSFEPLLVQDTSGNAIVMWAFKDSLDNRGLKASMFTFSNTSWSAASPVSLSTEVVEIRRIMPTYDLKINTNLDTVIAIWTAAFNDQIVIRTARAPFGGSWTTPVTIE